jgi:hypothetical protein
MQFWEARRSAENVALYAMPRMARNGRGYMDRDDPRLREAEFEVDPEDEVGRLQELLRQAGPRGSRTG